MGKRYANLWERIVANSAISDRSSYGGVPCRVWTGRIAINRSGAAYGRMNFRVNGRIKTEFVHRVVIREIKGRRLTKSMRGLHLCNNTVCCEPEHLAGGTQKQNVKQCVREGRHGNAYRAPVRESSNEALA